MNYSGANMKEQKLDKQMQEHQKIVDEIMAIQGIEPIEAEMEEVWHCPEGYIFKDENGNVINATKIVLEKEKEEDKITLEELKKCMNDYAYWLRKYVRFTDKDGNVLKIVLEKKKKEYPKTYEECCEALEYIPHTDDIIGYKWNILQSLQKLLICRDAYWKLYGEEVGLGKPWEPDWKAYDIKYAIGMHEDMIYQDTETRNNKILAFPTKEMRDAFKENFKELIEQCKELL